MSKKFFVIFLKKSIKVIAISTLACLALIFSQLFLQTFQSGVVYEYFSVFSICLLILISVLTILSITFINKNHSLIYKSAFLLIVLTLIFTCAGYYLKSLGFLDKIKSIEQLRDYIQSFGAFAVLLFVLIQFLQVVILPIPSVVTVGAGVLLFGPFLGALYSCIGIISGSIVAFLTGRFLGLKVVVWLLGEKNLKKGLKIIEGKDKVLLTFMFLFPFFPDDVLCFVSGITSINAKYFIIMITVVRIITVFCSSFSLNNSFIPYNTWWGILLWATFFSLTITATIFIYKRGNKIEKYFLSKFKKH